MRVFLCVLDLQISLWQGIVLLQTKMESGYPSAPSLSLQTMANYKEIQGPH